MRLYAGMAAMATTLALSAQQSADKQPNIILFLVDDMGWQETSVPFCCLLYTSAAADA